MKIKTIVMSLLFLVPLSTYASVRPGTSIKASIEAANRADIKTDLSNIGISDSSRVDTILTAVEKRIMTSDQLSSLLSISDAGKAELVKLYISDLLPAAINAESNNADAASLLGSNSASDSTAGKRLAEIQKVGALIVSSASDSTINTENLPKIMNVLKDLAEGKITEVQANLSLTSEKLVNIEEGQDALEALRDCTA